MSLIGNYGMGPNAMTGSRFAPTRGRMQGGAGNGVNYPSPFFDIAHTYLPTSMKALLRWCRYYFLVNPLINATVFKLSEYPVTDIILDHPSEGVKRQWAEYLQDQLNYNGFRVEVGLDYHVYGNACLSLGFPFKKYLYCSSCDFRDQAGKIRDSWIFTNHQFRLTCPKCHQVGDAGVKDFYIKDANAIKLIRWNPEDLEITYNDITGDYTYFYTIPPTVRNDIIVGRKDIVETTPQVFIQALREQKGIVFSKDNFFHMRRPTLANQDRGWGIPLLLPVLKDTFYLQIMKKAQECVAPTTLLETATGLLPASEVQVGTLVRTHTGALRPITQRAVRPMVEARGDYAVEIAVTGLRQLPSVFSDNHPMWVLRRNDKARRVDTKEAQRASVILRHPDLYDFQWVDAGQLTVGDYVGYPTNRVREEQHVDLASYTSFVATETYVYSGVSLETARAFEDLERGGHVAHDNSGRVAKRRFRKGEIPKRLPRRLPLDEDLAYIAGWYLGDGSIGARRVDFSMGPDDEAEELVEALARVFGVDCVSYASKKSHGWMLCACDTIAAEFFGGWIAGDAVRKRIPKEIVEAPDEIVLAFLRGYLEADGYTQTALRNKERIAVTCANKQITYQLWSLLLSLGCISTVSERTSYDTDITKLDGSTQHIEGGRPVFFWTVKSRSARRLAQLLAGEEAEFVVSGKSGFFIHDYFAARVQRVDVVGCPEVISFEVEGDHTFCVPGMATHNSLLLEHIVPLRVLFPQAGSSASDPYTSVNLVDWREHVAAEIARWRLDSNYIPILPLPIGNQTIGGDGRALLLTGEIQAWSEHILAGMGVPREFIFGGLSYSGSNVSMRIQENAFLGYILRHKQLLRFVMRGIANFLGWPEVKARFKPFKMADDLQRKALMFQYNQAQKISDTTMLADSDIDAFEENQIILREADGRVEAMKKQQLAVAEIQGEAQLVMSKFQVKAQQAMMQAQMAPAAPGEAGGPDAIAGGSPGGQEAQGSGALQMQGDEAGYGGMTSGLGQGQRLPTNAQGQPAGMNIDLPSLAMQQAQAISMMPPMMQKAAVDNLRAQSPELADLVLQMLTSLKGQGQQGVVNGTPQAGQIDARPMPEQRAPRRTAALI